LAIEYHSVSSGRTVREIVPFAPIDNGQRWHVRAFDRKTQEFLNFVINRISPSCSGLSR
jgi:predicted DNA-binding transcriptional regulator YafY